MWLLMCPWIHQPAKSLCFGLLIVAFFCFQNVWGYFSAMGAFTKQMRGSKLAPSSYSPCSFCSYDTFYRLHVHMRSNLCEHGRHIQRQQATYPKFLLDLWMKFLSWRHHQVLMSGFEASNTYDFYVNYPIFPRKQTHDRPVFLLKR